MAAVVVAQLGLIGCLFGVTAIGRQAWQCGHGFMPALPQGATVQEPPPSPPFGPWRLASGRSGLCARTFIY